MNENTQKKINWLMIVSILLGLLLITQTAGLVYYFSQKKSVDTTLLTKNVSWKNPIAPPNQRGSASVIPRSQYTHSPHPNYQDPWSIFDDMQESMNAMMGGLMTQLPGMMSQHMGMDSMPLVDMEEKNNSYIIRVDIPGLDKDKIDITVRGEILTIQGMREAINEEQSGSYYTQERSYGSFSRSLRLPGPVDDSNIKAIYSNGVLTITLPKTSNEAASKKVSVS